MFNISTSSAAVLLSFCAIVLALLAAVPWLDWAKYGNAWVINLASLPALPGILMVMRRRR